MADVTHIGRPQIVLTKAQVTIVEALAEYLSQDQIAGALGISVDTFQRIIRRDEVVEIAFFRGRSKSCLDISKKLVEAAKGGCFQSQRLYLTTMGGWSEKMTHEHVSPDGSMTPAQPAPVATYTRLPDGRMVYDPDQNTGATFHVPDNGREPAPMPEPEPAPVPKPKRSATKAKAKRKPRTKPAAKRKAPAKRKPKP